MPSIREPRSQKATAFVHLQTVEAVVKEVGDSKKVGVRLSPYNWEFNECYELDGVDATIALNVHLLKELNKFDLAYAHICSARIVGKPAFTANCRASPSPVPCRTSWADWCHYQLQP